MLRTQALRSTNSTTQGKCKCGGHCSHCAAPASVARARLSASAAFAPPSARPVRPSFAFANLPIHANGLAGGRSVQPTRPMATPLQVARESAGPGGVAAAGGSRTGGPSAPGGAGPASALAVKSGFAFASLPIHPPGLAGDRILESMHPATAPRSASHRIGGSNGVASGITSGSATAGGSWMTEPSDPSEREASSVAEQLFPLASQMASTMQAAKSPSSEDASLPAPPVQQEQPGTTGSCKTCGSAAKALGGHVDSGTPLPAETRSEMESAFGADF